jgi:tetratricopeptide (TPR) repeat protein
MVLQSLEANTKQTRLDTWKSIAEHLGRCSRTVQRWHSVYGLPIHHLFGESGSVYAYSDELDTWFKRRGKDESDQVAEPTYNQTSDPNFDDEPVQSSGTLDFSLVSIQARAHSAQLVVLANKMWQTLSHRNLTEILYRYREAVDLNPGNGAAYAGLSLGLTVQGIWGVVSPMVAYASAKAASDDAIEIDSELPLAKCATAWLKMCSTHDWQGARLDFDEILKHPIPCTLALNGRGLLYIAEGRLKDASSLLLQAARQNPLCDASMAFYCWSEYLAGEFTSALHLAEETRATSQAGPVLDVVEALATIQYEDSEAKLVRVEELAAQSPRNEVLQGALGYAFAVKGQGQRARDLLEALTNRTKRRIGHEPYAIALILIGLNERRQAVDWLEQSYRNGSLWSLGFRSDPILQSLRNDPHYQLFSNKANYPDPEGADSSLAFAG